MANAASCAIQPSANHESMSVCDLISILSAWQSRRIVVVGDFMLDRYTYGDADRISPEAPVPVLSIQGEEYRAGGAGNVALGVRALCCDVCCIGVIGRDDAGQRLKTELRDRGCDVAGLIAASDRATTVKHTIVGLAQHRHPQKMFRMDSECTHPLSDATEASLLRIINLKMRHADVLCIEDYNKGVLTTSLCRKIIALARGLAIPVVVDPAAIPDFGKYSKASVITPNRTEAARAAGTTVADAKDMTAWPALAKDLMHRISVDAVVITLDRQGALLLEGEGNPMLVPTRARQVYDVSGAGDTVTAMLCCARGNGATWQAAVELANRAAGLKVEQFGVVPITLDRVLLSLLDDRKATEGKVRSLDQLLVELRAHRSVGRSIVFTNGCFDILHAGHVALLRQARKLGDLLIVALNDDDSIRRLKGPSRPVNHLADRMAVLSELQSIDYLIPFSEDTPLKLIKEISPDVLAKGASYTGSDIVGADVVRAHGGSVRRIPMVHGRSTTMIIEQVRAASDDHSGSGRQ